MFLSKSHIVYMLSGTSCNTVHGCVCFFSSAKRLQALQLELTAVTLLRQQLEDGVRNNNELREQLCREIQRVNQREGAVQKVQRQPITECILRLDTSEDHSEC